MSDLGDLILSATPPAPDVRRIERQLRHLSRAIDAAPDGPRRDYLFAAYQALQWARSPDAFAPPVQSALPQEG